MQGFVHADMSEFGYTYIKLKRLELQYQRYGIAIVAGIARETRDIAYENFFDSTGGVLRYNTPDRPRYGKPPLVRKSAQEGYVDSRGYRLVNYSLESKRPSRKTAYVSSFPMNLYEHATKNGRPGLYIMTVKLPPLVQGIVPKHVALAEAKMVSMAQEALENGD
jgi:hypothetical protein